MQNQLLISSDHHANWDALEKLFQLAKEKKIPFIINGDIVGDYNFEQLAINLNYKLPYYVNPAGQLVKIKISQQDQKQLRALYVCILEAHAKKLAQFIEQYQTKVYYLNGNHEPNNFVEIVKLHLKSKEQITDLGTEQGITNINGIKIAGISNVNALMPFLGQIYDDEKLDRMFSHQRSNRAILHENVTPGGIAQSELEIQKDTDWIRISNQSNINDLDIFITHGQIGRGAWRADRQANEMPTLAVAAKLSSIAKITIDGHLHTTFGMRGPFDKPILRAVGNQGLLISKENNNMNYEKIKVDAEYDGRHGMEFNINELQKEITKKLN